MLKTFKILLEQQKERQDKINGLVSANEHLHEHIKKIEQVLSKYKEQLENNDVVISTLLSTLLKIKEIDDDSFKKVLQENDLDFDLQDAGNLSYLQ